MKRFALRSLAVLAITGVILAGAWYGARWRFRLGLVDLADSPQAVDSGLLTEMASLGRDGIEPLAEASASTNRAVALEARSQIDGLVRRWSQLEFEQPGTDLDDHRLQLAGELLARAERFSPSGQHWVSITATRLLQTSNDQTGDVRLIETCDKLLAAARRRTEVLDTVVEAPEPVVEETASPPAPVVAQTPPPVAPPAPPQVQPPAADNGGFSFAEALSRLNSTAPPDPAPPAPTATTTERTPPPALRSIEDYLLEGDPLAEADEPPRQPAPFELPWQAPSAQGPIGLSRGTGMTNDVFSSTPFTLTLLAAMPDRTLVERSLSTGDVASDAVLVARGFGGASPGDLARAISPLEGDRLRLIDDLLIGRGGAGARLLLLLASDASPRVRRESIAALASSGVRPLVDAAWRMAVRDPDPAVAALADEIRRR